MCDASLDLLWEASANGVGNFSLFLARKLSCDLYVENKMNKQIMPLHGSKVLRVVFTQVILRPYGNFLIEERWRFLVILASITKEQMQWCPTPRNRNLPHNTCSSENKGPSFCRVQEQVLEPDMRKEALAGMFHQLSPIEDGHSNRSARDFCTPFSLRASRSHILLVDHY
jgi:hypothetical protein